MIKVALRCTNPSPALRPNMSAVVNMLEGCLNIDESNLDSSGYDDEFNFQGLRDKYDEMQVTSSENQSVFFSTDTKGKRRAYLEALLAPRHASCVPRGSPPTPRGCLTRGRLTRGIPYSLRIPDQKMFDLRKARLPHKARVMGSSRLTPLRMPNPRTPDPRTLDPRTARPPLPRSPLPGPGTFFEALRGTRCSCLEAHPSPARRTPDLRMPDRRTPDPRMPDLKMPDPRNPLLSKDA
ncbi:hypothetical protein H5410_007517 [Solanum commersonii]|uniref:Uncharacterized protein n=1 Tax=Solanum commersonii TaxID=4109 RepID=A0A9J6AD92_SOLCO|nr:hypothetical protein H5410_007517 [Solanum commersonii]